MTRGSDGGRGGRRFRPRIEWLEDRTVPAGNVTVSALGGTLFVTGDGAGNQILIAGAGGSAVSIHSLDGSTTINGQTSLFVGDLDGRYVIDMGGGDDAVHFDNPGSDGSLLVNLGDGNDSFLINNSDRQVAITVLAGAGDDTLMFGNSGFRSTVSIDTGAGNDQVTASQIGAVDWVMTNPSGFDFFDEQGATLLRSSITGFINAARTDDTTPPTPTLSSSATSSTKTSPIAFAVNFDEAVTGFDASDLIVVNGSVTSFTQLDAQTYAFQVTPAGQGAVTATVRAGGATDSFGNLNVASNTITRTFDTVAPNLTITSKTTNDSTPTISGTVTDSTATVTVKVNNKTYTATVTGTTWSANVTNALADGTYSVTATATDPAGNSNSTTSATGLVVDATSPSISFSASPAQTTNAPTVTLTIVFSEDVTGFTDSDIGVGNATKTNFQAIDGKTYKIDLMPTVDGNVSINILQGAASDAAANQSQAATFTILYDTTPPTGIIKSAGMTTITGTSTDPGVPSASVKKVEISIQNSMGQYYTGPGGGFNSGSEVFLLTATTDNFANWTFDMPTVGTYTVRAKITDNATNVATISQTVIIEQTAPDVAVDATPTAANVVTGTASDTDTGISGVVVSVLDSSTSKYLSATGFFDSTTQVFLPATSTSGSTFATWSLGVPGSGPYVVTAKATDGAGNTATDSKTVSPTDTVAPLVQITSTETDPTSAGTIHVSVVFNEDVTDFVAADLVGSVANGGASNLQSTDARHYTFDITPAGTDGDIIFTLATGAVQDLSGNGNAQATYTITYDGTPPSVTINPGPVSGKVTGTSADAPTTADSRVTTVEVSVFNGTNYLTGTGFNGTTPGFLPVTDTATGGNPAFSSWSFTLAQGTYDVTARVADAAGNTTTTTQTGLVVDTTAPAKPTLNLATADDSGAVGDLRTDKDTVTLTGTTEAGATVKLFAVTAPGTPGSGSPLFTTTAGTDGKFSFANISLPVGPSSFAVQAVDAAGNASVTFAQTFTRNTPPTVANPIATQTATAGGPALTFNLAGGLTPVFADAEQVVRFTTTYPTGQTGNIDINLFAGDAPGTVANFLAYVNSTTASQNFNSSIFHRLVSGFALQGGGYKFNDSGTTTATAFPAITKLPAIADEPGISNTLGTISMAKSGAANTATSEFFFNLGDNSANLDNQAGGFTVFGQVMNGGQQTVNAIAGLTPFNGTGIPGAGPFPVRSGANTTNFPANINSGDLAFITTAAELTAAQRMTFSVVSNTVPAAATAAVVNNTLTITPKATGTTVVTVKATDLDGSSTTIQITVNVS